MTGASKMCWLPESYEAKFLEKDALQEAANKGVKSD
jgi:hypothetical protein